MAQSMPVPVVAELGAGGSQAFLSAAQQSAGQREYADRHTLLLMKPGSLASYQEDAQKAHVRRSCFRGLTWDKKERRWRVRINVMGKQHHVGRFVSEMEAARAFDRAALCIYGDLAITNFGQDAARADRTPLSAHILIVKQQYELFKLQQQQAASERAANSIAASGAGGAARMGAHATNGQLLPPTSGPIAYTAVHMPTGHQLAANNQLHIQGAAPMTFYLAPSNYLQQVEMPQAGTVQFQVPMQQVVNGNSHLPAPTQMLQVVRGTVPGAMAAVSPSPGAGADGLVSHLHGLQLQNCIFTQMTDQGSAAHTAASAGFQVNAGQLVMPATPLQMQGFGQAGLQGAVDLYALPTAAAGGASVQQLQAAGMHPASAGQVAADHGPAMFWSQPLVSGEGGADMLAQPISSGVRYVAAAEAAPARQAAAGDAASLELLVNALRKAGEQGRLTSSTTMSDLIAALHQDQQQQGQGLDVQLQQQLGASPGMAVHPGANVFMGAS